MERDFMGLNFKDPFFKVKEEVDESSKDSGFPNGYGVHWPSTSQVSAVPHYLSVMSAKDKKPPRLSPDLAPPGFTALSLSDGSNLGNNLQSAENQNPRTIMKLPVFGRIPATKSHLFHPSNAFVAGMTEPRCTFEPSGAPAELTIFYAGRVDVYNDISPEKAQAIMFLAGNGCSTSNRPPPEDKVQATTSNYMARDDAFMNNIINTSLCSSLPSPMAVSSHPIGQTIGGLIKREESRAYETVGISTSHTNEVPTSKLETSLGPLATSILPSAVPQARKASLARFLEKRKERVMSSSPYQLGNKSGEGTAESSAAAESNTGFSATSSVSSRSISIEKDVNL